MAKKIKTTLDRRAVINKILDKRGDALIVTGLGSSCYDVGAAGVHVQRADHAGEVVDMVAASAALAFDSAVPVAVLFSQRLIGAKVFVNE